MAMADKKRAQISGNKCSLPHCQKSRRDFPALKLFRFPEKEPTILMKWAEKCQFTEDFVASTSSLFLCQDHFCPDDIGIKYLRRGTIPDRNLGNEHGCDNDEIDFSAIRSPPRKRPRSQSPAEICRQCHRSTKTLKCFQKKYASFKKLADERQERIKMLRRENSNLKRKVIRLEVKSKKNILSEIEKMNLTGNEKILAKMLLKEKKGTNMRWNDSEKLFAQSIYYRSTSTYMFLRDSLELNLPSPSSLQKWNSIRKLQPGDNECLYSALKDTIRDMAESEKECIITCDEVAIKKNLTYNSSVDVIDGLEHLLERSNKMGSHICVFAIRGILKKWKFVLNYFVPETNIKGECLKSLIHKNINIAESIGFKVRGMVYDQGGNNRKCTSLLGVTNEKPYFYFNNKKYYMFYDIPHLFKSLRNNLLKAKFETPDGIVDFDVIREVYELEQGSVTRMTKLTRSHVNPTRFELMRVCLATQTFSHTVAAAIKACNQNKQLHRNSSEVAASTAAFVQRVNDYFDCLNSRVLTDKNPMKCALQINNIVWNKLKEMQVYLKNVKYQGNNIYCLDGLLQTIEAMFGLVEDLFTDHTDTFFFLTSRVNQDPLENLFACVRAKGGNCRNPSVNEFNIIIAKLISLHIFKFSQKTNCESDDDVMLPVEFDSIIYQPGFEKKEIQQKEYSVSYSEIVQDNERYFDKNIDNFLSNDVPIELTSSRYFCGYIAKASSCDNCRSLLIKENEQLTVPSELFIYEKNYSSDSDFGKLNAPSDIFFNVCKIHIKVFENIFRNNKKQIQIRKFIVEQCIKCTNESTDYSLWFDINNECYVHKTELLNKLIKVLLFKHCKWTVIADRQKKLAKLNILSHK